MALDTSQDGAVSPTQLLCSPCKPGIVSKSHANVFMLQLAHLDLLTCDLAAKLSCIFMQETILEFIFTVLQTQSSITENPWIRCMVTPVEVRTCLPQ